MDKKLSNEVLQNESQSIQIPKYHHMDHHHTTIQNYKMPIKHSMHLKCRYNIQTRFAK
jgi:hypothetical protein